MSPFEGHMYEGSMLLTSQWLREIPHLVTCLKLVTSLENMQTVVMDLDYFGKKFFNCYEFAELSVIE